jgi:hypothetical protein
LFTGLVEEALPDIALGRQLRQIPTLPAPTRAPVDLNGRSVILLAIGAGHSGCTSFLRWAAEMALARDPNCTSIFAAIGDRRDLALYPFTVSQPAGFGQAPETQWLEGLIAHCMREKVGAAIDFDGGDTALTSVVAQHDDLCGMVEASGAAIVAAYLLSHRVTDLSTLATLEDAGFQPAATMLILNDGTGSETEAFDAKFAAIRRHSAFVRAQERGAVVLRMPRLHAARAVELRRLLFAHCAGEASPLHVFESDRVRHWLQAMDAAFEPVAAAGWLP